jgi:hypothetical protein
VKRPPPPPPDCGAGGYVFAAPAQRDPERVWDQSNSAGAVRAALDACGLTWAGSAHISPHSRDPS